MLAQDGAGRISTRLPHPAGPQAAFSGDPRRGSVTVPSAGMHTQAQCICVPTCNLKSFVLFTRVEANYNLYILISCGVFAYSGIISCDVLDSKISDQKIDIY